MASRADAPQLSPSKPRPSKPTTGLALWMERVLEECDHAAAGLSPDSVHDLRVALRRCRSVADGIMAIDPDPEWKRMKKAGRILFRSLGALRDVHVMQEWVQRIGVGTDALTTVLRDWLQLRETEFKNEAARAVQSFDRKQWRIWATSLPRRSARLRKGSDVFEHLALERWTQAHELHRQALRNRSQIAFHNLRIGIKRFRYIVENFLPTQHAAWADDLKELQDLLGEVHDLDVLWATVQQLAAFGDDEAKFQWRNRIATERERRIGAYRGKMLGKDSLWQHWRKSLPVGEHIRAAALKRLKLWAAFFDPDLEHSNHVAKLAVQLFEGLSRVQISVSTKNGTANGEKETLRMAALLHEIGQFKKEKNYEKTTYKLIQRVNPPLGWSPESWRMVAVVARFHRRTLPVASHKTLRTLPPAERQTAYRLAGILRLAEALDVSHDRGIQRVEVKEQDRIIVIHAQGYSARDRSAESIAGARHLLEVVYRRPVMVKPLLVHRRRHSNLTPSQSTRPLPLPKSTRRNSA
jgi:CHAD domain-containing protein/HD superfamily phosphodiesterase